MNELNESVLTNNDSDISTATDEITSPDLKKSFDVYVTSITTTTHQKELMIKLQLGDVYGYNWTSPLKSHSSTCPKPFLHGWEPAASFRNLCVSDYGKYKVKFSVHKREKSSFTPGKNYIWVLLGDVFTLPIDQELAKVADYEDTSREFSLMESSTGEPFYMKYQVIPSKNDEETKKYLGELSEIPVALEYPQRVEQKKLPKPPENKLIVESLPSSYPVSVGDSTVPKYNSYVQQQQQKKKNYWK